MDAMFILFHCMQNQTVLNVADWLQTTYRNVTEKLRKGYIKLCKG